MGKIRFLKSKIGKEPYNSFYDDFYRECDCGWKGKEESTNRILQHQKAEEDSNAFLREMYEQSGWDIPDILIPNKSQQEGEDFSPFDDLNNLPF